MPRLTRRAVGKAALATGFSILVAPPSRAQERYDVVIVGGGFGGATAAKYVRKVAPSLSVALIEQNPVFYTCPFSNLVLGGIRPLNSIAHRYDTLRSKWGVTVIHERAGRIEPGNRQIRMPDGRTVGFEKAILSPGIDFRYDTIPGYSKAALERIPHAWKAGVQTRDLRLQLEEMPDGGVVIIAPPDNPYRCPPGPYERASLIAHYLKNNKPKSKVLILDPKRKFSKEQLFKQAWKELYPGMIEHVSGEEGAIARVDQRNLTLETAFGDRHKGDVVNLIPPQTAGVIATNAGLGNEDGWCPVNPATFESALAKDLYIIGDAADGGAMPKSGFSANSQGKIAALNVVAALTGREPVDGSLANTCYSLIAPDYGISVAKVYRSSKNGIVGVEGSGGLSPKDADADFRATEAQYAEGWYDAITQDMFG